METQGGNFKFKVAFGATITEVRDAEAGKHFSTADFDKMKSLVPKDMDLGKNPDLLAVVGNAAVGNKANLNHDAISNATAAAVAGGFKWKFVDMDHNRNRIVGVVCNAGLTKFDTNEPITEEEAAAQTAPVNISVAMFLYKVAMKPEFLEFLRSSVDPSSPNYQKVSLSWEIFFNDYDIAVGPDRNLSTAKIYSKGEERDALEKLLPSNGGAGSTKDGQLVYRVIGSDILVPAAVGLVANPAADVKGLAIAGEKKAISVGGLTINDKPIESIIRETTLAILAEQSRPGGLLAVAQAISQPQKPDVTPDRKDIMTIKTIDDVKAIKPEQWEEAKASTAEFIAKEIEKASEKWAKEKAEQANAAKLAQERHEAVLAEAKKAKEDLDAVNRKVAELQASIQAQNDQEKFNARMTELDETYSLDAEARKVVATAIKGISDESYAAYKAQLEVLLKGSRKSEESTASVQNAVTEAVKNGTPKQEPITKPADNVSSTQTVKEKYAAAFAPEQTIVGRKNQV